MREALTPGWSRRGTRVVGAAVALATLTLMLATEPRLAIVWDEGCTLGREARARAWFRLLIHPGLARSWRDPPELDLVPGDRPEHRFEVASVKRRSDLFRPDALAWFWPFAREEPHGHPPFYALIGLIGDIVAPRWSLLRRARLGPMLVFSLTAGATFAFLAGRGGGWAGAAGTAAWVLHPHLFALGHYAHYDGILSALWLGAVLAFSRATERSPTSMDQPRWAWVIAFGMLAGWAADTKFTGWLLLVPFTAWTIVARDRRAWRTLAAGALIAAVTLYLFNPPFWADPVDGIRRFLASNLGRAHTIPLPVLFLGKVITTPTHSLPWYNTLLWTLAATPAGLLGLALAGGAWSVRQAIGEGWRCVTLIHPRWGALPTLALANAMFLLAVRALPHTPGHDGVRLFLPAFGGLALLAGPGAARLVQRLGSWGKWVVGLALVEAAVGLALILPVPLSYFSPLVGGLPGARRLGLEPTYYWDALDAGALAWLDRNTPPAGAVRFAMFPRTLLHLHRAGRLRPEPVRPESDRSARWYVLQNRPGMFRPVDRFLLAHGRPSYVVAKWGVPLVLIYADFERERYQARTARAAGPGSRAVRR